MKSASNLRRWIVPGGWLLTAAAAFSIGRMSSWLDEPIVPPNANAYGAAGGAGAAGSAGGAGETRAGIPTTLGSDRGPALTIEQVTGGQPLEDWLKKLMAQEDDIYRMRHFMKLFDTLNTPEDIKTALAVIAPSGRGRGMRFAEYSMLLQKLTQLDPKEGIAFATAQEGGERFMATGTVLRTWAKNEPDAALAWAKENGNPQNTENGGNDERRGNDNFALTSVISELGKTNLDKALTEAGLADLGRGAGRAADALAQEAIEQRGPEQAKALLESLPEGDFRNEFLEEMAGRLAAKDPVGTLKWIQGLPEGEGRREAIGDAVSTWMRSDAPAATKYVNGLPVSADYDATRQRVAGQVARNDPNTALELIGKITEPERQLRTVGEVVRDLARGGNVPAAQQFVNATSLDAEMKQQINQRLSEPQRDGGRGREFFRGGGRPGGR